MSQSDNAKKRGVRAGAVPQWLWALGLLAAILTAAQSLSVSYMGSGWSAPRGSMGINPLSDCASDRFCPVTSVRPKSPAAGAGIHPGDRLKLDRYWERHRTLFPNEQIGMTVRSGGQARHVVLTTAATRYYALAWIVDGIACAAVCLIALLILARAGRNWSSFLLGCALIGIGMPGGYPRFWQNDPLLYPWFFAALAIVYMASPVLMLAALRGFRREVIGHSPAWLDRMVWASGIIAAIATVLGTAVELDSAPILGLSDGLWCTSLTWSLCSLLGPVALAAGWHEVPSRSRTRYAFMWAAVGVSSLHALFDPLVLATGAYYSATSWPVVLQLTSTIVGAGLFAYAILRHRVIDLGFVINRTLVYSALSFLTLIIFALVEWATEKLIPVGYLKLSAVIEAAVALTLSLMFSYLHAWVERMVERLFFRRRHTNEAALKRFLHEASYIIRSDVLIERMIEALQRFSEGAAAAFYRATPNGFVLEAGENGFSPTLDVDEPAIVALRAHRKIVHEAFAAGHIALPMTHRADVMGFVLLGPKPGGSPYRIDEEELLAEAVRRIGLDRYALRVEELEETNARLCVQLATLGAGAKS